MVKMSGDIPQDTIGYIPFVSRRLTEQELLRDKQKLVVEIACGNGHFLTELSQRDVDSEHIGIEIKAKRVKKCCKKVKNNSYENVRFLHGEAFASLTEMFPENSIDSLYVNFPDPWPKYKHKKYRINSWDYFEMFEKMLKKGGHFFWATDYFPQLVDVLKLSRQLEKAGLWENVYASAGYANHVDWYYPSVFETLWREQGRKIFYLSFKKIR